MHNIRIKKYKLHPIGWAIKWALKDCSWCIANYASNKLIYWSQDTDNYWHVEISLNQ